MAKEERLIDRILSNRKVKSSVRKAARQTQRSGHECGFLVAEKPNGTITPAKVVEGSCDKAGPYDFLECFSNGIDIDWSLRAFVHFHPDPELPTPSREDMSYFLQDNIVDIVDKERLAFYIGTVDNQETIHLLAVSVNEKVSERLSRLRQTQRKQIAKSLLDIGLQPLWEREWINGEQDRLIEIFEDCGLEARFRKIKLK